jgi:phosphate transport system substrate-binding protein
MKSSKTIKMIAGIILLSIITFAFMPAPKKITIKGSDTMVILAQKWAEVYMKSHPEVSLQVTGGGSGTGISALINGATDICNASRPMKQSEIDKLKERYGSLGVEIRCAKDGITVYMNESNPVKELSIKQLSGIYKTGKKLAVRTKPSSSMAVRTAQVPMFSFRKMW